MGRSFSARYDGSCVECFDDIFEGDLIKMTDDGAVHEDCAPAEPERVTFPI